MLVTRARVSSASRTFAYIDALQPPSSKMFTLARSSNHVWDSTHSAIRTATAESTHRQPVNLMTNAPE